MTFWHDVQPDFYLPAGLKLFPGDYDVKGYNADMTDKDFKQVIDNKAQFGPSKAGRKLRGDNNNDNNSTSSVGHGHLVISDHEDHSAKELCESSSSLGPDFVSTGEGIFCDMNQKEYWFLCNADIKTGCFDLKKKEMVGATPGIATRDLETGRIIPEKRYNTHSRWKPDMVRVRRTKMGPWRRWVMDIVSPLQAN